VWGTDSTAHNIGALQSVGVPNYSETLGYDGFGRLNSRRITIDQSHDYYYNYSYDDVTGLLDTETYPASTSGYRLAVKHVYDHGVLSQVKNGSTIYWQADAINALGQITRQTLGNGTATSRQFDAVTGFVSTVQSGP